MKNSKITTIQWILCITGIIILTLIAVLPPVLRIMIPKEPDPIDVVITPSPSPVPTKPTEEPKLPITGALTCTKKESDVTGYTNQITRSIQYQDNKVIKVINTYVENYMVIGTTNKEARDAKKVICEQTSIIYTGIPGFIKVCGAEGENTFTTNEIFDLSTFEDTSLETETGIESITSEIKFEEEISSVKTRLEESGYFCSQ